MYQLVSLDQSAWSIWQPVACLPPQQSVRFFKIKHIVILETLNLYHFKTFGRAQATCKELCALLR